MTDYRPLPTVSEKDEEGSSEQDDSVNLRPSRRASLRRWLWTWTWIFHVFFFAIYAGIVFIGRQQMPLGYFWGLENIYNDAPKEVETVVFKRSGFHGPTSPHLTPYEGRPNIHNDAEWDRLMEVGVVGISKAEAGKLPEGTTESMGNPGTYVVQLEMFHQLHCLKQLRKQLWEFEDGIADPREASQRQQHFDHCIDYLRQVVMCHGDITPVTFEWNVERNIYLAHHGTIHQCRNFNTIYKWAASRNTAGLAVDGEHKSFDGAAKFDPAPN